MILEKQIPNKVPLFTGYNDVYYWNRDSDAFITVNQGGTSCFAPDTLVQTLDGAKLIRDIAIGDLVKTYDELAGLIMYSPVIDTSKFNNTKRTVEVVMNSGAVIRCTEDHKFYHESRWVQIIELLENHTLPNLHTWSYVEEPVVYDIEVQGTRNYFLQVGEDSVLVHNSSKTYSIMQLLCTLAIEKTRNIQVFGQDAPNLYVGAIADMKRLIADSAILRECLKNPNLDRGPFKFKNGSVIQFTTAQTAQDAKSGKRDILFINEANGVSYEIAFELIARTTERVFIDYNPNARFWVHHELEGSPDVKFLISNFTHNKFLADKIRKQIMSWKEKYEVTNSTYWRNKWLVYGLGLTGVVEGTVFDHVDTCSFFPAAAKHVIYGLDFGFKNNYTALVKIGVYNEAVYGKEILYEQGLNSVKLAELLESIGIDKNQKIIADPANSEAITILQDKGFNIVPAKKGQDSIKVGIELIQSYPLYITKDSKNWWVEVENYKYKKDVNGRFTNNPIDEYNDCFVAGTLVETSTGLKSIEIIEVGDYVMTSVGYNKVVRTWRNGVKDVNKYSIQLGEHTVNITCTEKHKIKTVEGWKQVKDLQEGDVVFLRKTTEELPVPYTLNKEVAQKVVVTNIQKENVGYREVYDLTVENEHEYFVDNLLVSNCHDAARYAYVELFGLRLRKPTARANTPYQRKIYSK